MKLISENFCPKLNFKFFWVMVLWLCQGTSSQLVLFCMFEIVLTVDKKWFFKLCDLHVHDTCLLTLFFQAQFQIRAMPHPALMVEIVAKLGAPFNILVTALLLGRVRNAIIVSAVHNNLNQFLTFCNL